MWLAVHRIPGFGPLVADTLRSVFGSAFVARLEDTAYGVEDWINRKTRKAQPPEAMWEVPPASPDATVSTTPSPSAGAGGDGAKQAEPVVFSLPALKPMYENIATKHDGVWVKLEDPRHPGDPVRLLKTFVHPDKHRSWSIVAVVAIDLEQVALHPVAGRFEPKSKTKAAKDYTRGAVVPAEHRDVLIAAFNGGYKSTHGDYGMKLDGVTLVPPRGRACTIAQYQDGHYEIRSWKAVADREAEMRWYRQTPICMYEDGKPHPALSMKSIGWGASAVSGTTIIRRSAIGLNAAGTVMFVGIGDFCSGKAIAEALQHAGAHNVAQLDVNFSFPKFVTYRYLNEGRPELEALPLTKHFEFTPDQYVGTRSHRDFFYLRRK